MTILRLHKAFVAGLRKACQQYEVFAGMFQAYLECPPFIDEIRLQQQEGFVNAVTAQYSEYILPESAKCGLWTK